MLQYKLLIAKLARYPKKLTSLIVKNKIESRITFAVFEIPDPPQSYIYMQP